jgi:hypothetical protein
LNTIQSWDAIALEVRRQMIAGYIEEQAEDIPRLKTIEHGGKTLRRLRKQRRRPYMSAFGPTPSRRDVYATRETQRQEVVPLDAKQAHRVRTRPFAAMPTDRRSHRTNWHRHPAAVLARMRVRGKRCRKRAVTPQQRFPAACTFRRQNGAAERQAVAIPLSIPASVALRGEGVP